METSVKIHTVSWVMLMRVEDPAHYKPGTTNASDSNEFSPVLVTGRTMKLIPSSLNFISVPHLIR